MIKDLTSLKWKKNIYYISEGIIFDIESRSKTFDIDYCGEYLIDLDKLPEKEKNSKDGTSIDISKYPESFTKSIPYIYLEFESEEGDKLERFFPVQSFILEGDKFVDGKCVQFHPNVFNNSYVNKFNQSVFDYIKTIVNGKEPLNSKNIKLVSESLPCWLFDSSEYMAEEYIDKYFLKGSKYNNAVATKLKKDGVITYQLKLASLGVGENLSSINFWNSEVIFEVLKSLLAEKIVNDYNQAIKNSSSNAIVKDSMESIAQYIKDITIGKNENKLSTFLNVIYNGENVEVDLKSLCVPSDIDTYYEYIKKQEEEKEKIKSYYSLINDEASWNALYKEGTGLWKYYQWSDQANAPYKEDLWNTVENRAANINDAKKDPETGEYLLDENGNYIYENCERCWLGAVNAPGAKYPWIVLNITDEIPSTVTFKYTYLDGTIKEVQPWGDKIFGGDSSTRREWGVASVASEFKDNDFLISENGGQSTFDINNFELVLNPVE